MQGTERVGSLQCVQMLHSIHAQWVPAVQARLVLLVNHVLSREPTALERLRAHAGRRIRIAPPALPGWLPALPEATLAVTPAGMFELDTAAAEPDLGLRFAAADLPQLLATLTGQSQPAVQIDGDAALAGDIRWLVDHLRWDLESDLADLIGPAPAHQLAGLGRAAAAALRSWVPAPGAGGR
jgi:ubiquinone biosynthesis accessory factor UbiJ